MLAIEQNQHNQTILATENIGSNGEESDRARTIVDEYQQLASYDIFKKIVEELIKGEPIEENDDNS